MTKNLKKYAAVICLILGLIVMNTFGQEQAEKEAHSGLGFGVRGGFGLDPNQFVVGAQFSLGKALHLFRVVPSVDLGLGGGKTTVAFNMDFLLRLMAKDISLGLYAGAGPTVMYMGAGPTVMYKDHKDADGDWDLGLSTVLGGQLPLSRKFATNIEARFGIGSIPDFRLILGIIF
jgi:hypothetical protein